METNQVKPGARKFVFRKTAIAKLSLSAEQLKKVNGGVDEPPPTTSRDSNTDAVLDCTIRTHNGGTGNLTIGCIDTSLG